MNKFLLFQVIVKGAGAINPAPGGRGPGSREPQKLTRPEPMPEDPARPALHALQPAALVDRRQALEFSMSQFERPADETADFEFPRRRVGGRYGIEFHHLQAETVRGVRGNNEFAVRCASPV